MDIIIEKRRSHIEQLLGFFAVYEPSTQDVGRVSGAVR